MAVASPEELAQILGLEECGPLEETLVQNAVQGTDKISIKAIKPSDIGVYKQRLEALESEKNRRKAALSHTGPLSRIHPVICDRTLS